MLGNDTWFMYEASKMDELNADGFGGLGAEGGDGISLSADGEDESGISKGHVLDCANLPQTKFCKKHPASPICVGRIKKCEKHNAKLDSLRGEASQAKGIADTLKTDAQETASKTASASATTGADGGDNTMTYIAIGGVALLALGGLAFFLLRKKSDAPAA